MRKKKRSGLQVTWEMLELNRNVGRDSMGDVLVNLTLGELTLRTDDSPNDRCSSEDLGARTLQNHTQNANHRTKKDGGEVLKSVIMI